MESGTFKLTLTQDVCDFWTKMGMDEMKDMLGTHWTTVIKPHGSTKFSVRTLCEEIPAMHHYAIFEEGKEHVIPDYMGFGTSKVTFQKDPTKKGTWIHQVQTEKVGTFTMRDIYTEEGANFEFTCKEKGLTFTEKWQRFVDPSGSYKFVGGENLENFTTMVPEMEKMKDEFTKGTWSFTGEWNGDWYTETVYFPSTTMVFNMKLDEEWKFPGNDDITYITTRLAPGRFKQVGKHKNGTTEVSDLIYTDEGVKWVIKNSKTGKPCTFNFEKFVHFTGNYTLMTPVMGLNNAGEMLGTEMVKGITKLSDDMMTSGVLRIKEEGDVVKIHMDCNVLPHKTTFKLGEEMTQMHPFLKEEMNFVATKWENVLQMVGTSQTYQQASTFQFSKSFLIVTNTLNGVTWKCMFKKTGWN